MRYSIAILSCFLYSFLYSQDVLLEPVVLVSSGYESGTGIYLGEKEGQWYFLTAAHIIEDASNTMLTFRGKQSATASVFQADERNDVVVLTCKPPMDEPPVSFKFSDSELVPLQSLLVISHPYGNNWDINNSPEVKDVSLGYDDDFFTITPEGINPGSSGGAVLNQDYELVGMLIEEDPVKATCVAPAILLKMLDFWQVPLNGMIGISKADLVAGETPDLEYQLAIQQGDVYFKRKQWQEALNAYKKANELKPNPELELRIQLCQKEATRDRLYTQFKLEGLAEKAHPEKALDAYLKAQEQRNTEEIREMIASVRKLLPDDSGKAAPTIVIPEKENYVDAYAGPMIYVQGGTFTMGDDDGEADDGNSQDEPPHEVTVSDFYIGKYEITLGEFVDFLNEKGNQIEGRKPWYKLHNEGGGNFLSEFTKVSEEACRIKEEDGQFQVVPEFECKDYPVDRVSWYGAMAYARWVSEKTGVSYSLPTEAEWEFAAKGGLKSKGYLYSGSNKLGEVAAYQANGGDKTVGSRKPNELGIHDMSGNMLEWCQDWYSGTYYRQSRKAKDPQGPKSGNRKALRGGSRSQTPYACETTSRQDRKPSNGGYHTGFRLVAHDYK